ncbi:inorganic phosphate transporter [soil metagenome]
MTGLVVIIALAFAFDYINGFHDAANSIATIVSTRVLSPRMAVLWAALFNFIAFLVFSTHVASNIAKGVDNTKLMITLALVAAGLIGAIVWNLLTWWLGLPSSSSHALMGALAGAAITKAGFGCLNATVFRETALFIVIAPVLGGVLAFGLMTAIRFFFGRFSQRSIDKNFRILQFGSAALYSLGHGGNDAQKKMGIIVMALVATGNLVAAQKGETQHVPFWVVIGCHLAMALGTLSGGWRIVKTMGMKITKLQPVGGFAAETAGAITLALATFRGIPVSTTHTITGAIVGVGSTQKLSAVRWGVAGRIVWAWVLTIPGAAAISAISYLIMRACGLE